MLDLLNAILSRATELTADELWDDPATEDGTIALRTFRGGLPPKRSTPEQGHDHPFLLARIMNGGENTKQGRIIVRLVGCLHTHTSVDDGLVDVDRLLKFLLQIPEKRDYELYALEDDVTWFLGDPKTGNQPYPKFYITVDLEFTREPMMNNY